jgi:hypothetical protein
MIITILMSSKLIKKQKKKEEINKWKKQKTEIRIYKSIEIEIQFSLLLFNQIINN